VSDAGGIEALAPKVDAVVNALHKPSAGSRSHDSNAIGCVMEVAGKNKVVRLVSFGCVRVCVCACVRVCVWMRGCVVACAVRMRLATHVWMDHVAHANGSCHMYASRSGMAQGMHTYTAKSTCIHESWMSAEHTYKWMSTCINESWTSAVPLLVFTTWRMPSATCIVYLLHVSTTCIVYLLHVSTTWRMPSTTWRVCM